MPPGFEPGVDLAVDAEATEAADADEAADELEANEELTESSIVVWTAVNVACGISEPSSA
jgi:hypothetical protein